VFSLSEAGVRARAYPGRRKKVGTGEIRACTRRNLLKSPETAKGMFGKAWRKQAKKLEILDEKLQKFG
jgi:hypothetical protein